MKRLLVMMTLPSWSLSAQDHPAFEPPQAYDIGRYEAGWNKNPFTLKTAPTPVANAAFAKDLAIGTFYGSTDDPTIVLVNTKTHERLRLKQGLRTGSGITLQAVNLAVSRSEAFVEIHSSSGESALVRFDEGYLRQVAANAAKNTPAAPGQQPPSQTGVTPVRPAPVSAASSRKASPGTVSAAPVPAALAGILPPSAFASSVPSANAGNDEPPTTPGTSAAAPSAAPSATPANTTPTTASPQAQRRRSITAVRF